MLFAQKLHKSDGWYIAVEFKRICEELAIIVVYTRINCHSVHRHSNYLVISVPGIASNRDMSDFWNWLFKLEIIIIVIFWSSLEFRVQCKKKVKNICGNIISYILCNAN